MKDMNFDDVLALSPAELRKRARSKGWALSALGRVVYAFLRLFGQKPKDFQGICPYFALFRGWGGFSLGWLFICATNSGDSTKEHEVGHILQNAKVGGWKMLGLSIASACRYWKRRLCGSRSAYDAWWFEGQATRLGKQYVTRWKETHTDGKD